MEAHCAPLGLRFYTGATFPEQYRGKLFVAEHGSWNRTDPIGYRVTLMGEAPGGQASYAPFAEGWLQKGKPWGRPVDVLVEASGSLLVSDDEAGVVYRISYRGR